MIGKPRGRAGKRPVFVYDSTKTSGKRYVGQSADLAECRRLELQGQLDVLQNTHVLSQPWTVDAWADHWLEALHGDGTKRPGPMTLKHNRQQVKAFRDQHGKTKLAAIDRTIAEGWAHSHAQQAKSVGAMFADALDKGHITINPFTKLGLKVSRGRADIDPLTEAEIDTLSLIAGRSLGLYGPEFAALIRFAGWTGMRPGELCALDWVNVDLRAGEVRIDRAVGNRRADGTLGPPKHGRGRFIPLADEAKQALQAIPRRPGMVFRSKTGKTLMPGNFRFSWNPVRAVFLADLPPSHWLPRRLMVNPKDHLDVYELRHAFGSMLADRGMSARDISVLMGNTEKVCSERYLHVHKDRLRDRTRAAFGSNVRDLKPVEEAKAS